MVSTNVHTHMTTSTSAITVVKRDGTRYLYLRVYNPAFTLQSAGTCADLPDLRVIRDWLAEALAEDGE